MTPWYDKNWRPAARRDRQAAEWQDTTSYLRDEFAHHALASAGDFSALNLHLIDKAEAVALKNSPALVTVAKVFPAHAGMSRHGRRKGGGRGSVLRTCGMSR